MKGAKLLMQYPISNSDVTESSETVEQHINVISKELDKAKPRDSILLPLIWSTYGHQRLFILTEVDSVNAILDAYPAFYHQTVVNSFYRMSFVGGFALLNTLQS